MQNRTEAIAEIEKLHSDMRDHVVRAGVGEKRWAKVVSKLTKQPDHIVEFIHKFLVSLKANEWNDINVTWNLPNATPDMWEHMALFYEHDSSFPELQRLKGNQRKLRAAWGLFWVKLQELKADGAEESKK